MPERAERELNRGLSFTRSSLHSVRYQYFIIDYE